MIELGFIAALLTLLLVGGGICALLMREWRVCNVAEFVSLGAFFGSAAVSLLLWCGGFFLSGALLQIAVAICAVVIGALGWRTIRAHQIRFALPTPQSRAEAVLFALLAIEITSVILISLGRPVGWDSTFNWEIKARFAFLNGGTMPPQYYASQSQALTHPEYPLFIPFTQLWIDMWIGCAHQFWEKTIFSVWTAAGIILLCIYSARISGRRSIGLIVGVLAFFAPYLMRRAGGVTGGYADFPLGVIYFVAIASLLRLQRRKIDIVYFRIYAAALALLPWMKREGAIVWCVAAACGLIVLRKRLTNPKCWFAFAAGPVVMIGWSLYLRLFGAAPSHDFVAINARSFAQHADRIWPIAQTLLSELITPTHWSLFWVLVFAALVQQIFRARSEGVFVRGGCARRADDRLRLELSLQLVAGLPHPHRGIVAAALAPIAAARLVDYRRDLPRARSTITLPLAR